MVKKPSLENIGEVSKEELYRYWRGDYVWARLAAFFNYLAENYAKEWDVEKREGYSTRIMIKLRDGKVVSIYTSYDYPSFIYRGFSDVKFNTDLYRDYVWDKMEEVEMKGYEWLEDLRELFLGEFKDIISIRVFKYIK